VEGNSIFDMRKKDKFTESRFLMNESSGNERYEKLKNFFETNNDGVVKKQIMENDTILLIINARNSLKPEISKIIQS
jgi:hypothetical protein